MSSKLFSATNSITLQAVTIRLARPDRIGVANATLSTATDLGVGLGAILLGWVSQYTSYMVLFMISAVSVAFSLVIVTLSRFRTAREDAPARGSSESAERAARSLACLGHPQQGRDEADHVLHADMLRTDHQASEVNHGD